LAWVVLFHDVVYRPGRHDNEAESARHCRRRMVEAGEPAACRDEVEHAILWSARHEREAADTPLLRAFFDADLGILGLSPQRYDLYVGEVEAEYLGAGTQANLFARGRLAFLELLAARLSGPGWSFGLDPLHDVLARQNVGRELARRRAEEQAGPG
jgi:predicted metal-dependent HD superfamily phosphohydrolase